MNRLLRKQRARRVQKVPSPIQQKSWFLTPNRLLLGIVAMLATMPTPSFAQSPWETAVQNLQTSFTGPIAKGLSLVAIVVGGLMFAYGEGAGKKVFAGIVFGIGMAIGAVNFMAWMFPG